MSAAKLPQGVASTTMRWFIDPQYQDVLLGPGGLRIQDWLNSGQAQIVKQGPHRLVYRLELPNLRCYIKHNRVSDGRSWLRQLIRPSKARQEYQLALEVAARGVPTVEPLAYGESRTGQGDSYLITRSLEHTQQLDHFLLRVLQVMPLATQRRLRHQLAAALGHFIAHLHNVGVAHHDLHCGNILLCLRSLEEPRFYLIDMQNVTCTSPMGWAASLRNLVLFSRWLVPLSNRGDRARFFYHYLQGRPQLLDSLPPHAQLRRAERHRLARVLEAATLHSNHVFWHHRDQRSLRVNRYFKRIRTSAYSGHALVQLDATWLHELLTDPDVPFKDGNVQTLKQSQTVHVIEMQARVGGELRSVIFKKFQLRSFRDPIANCFRRSPALRSWVFGHGLLTRGLPTAKPLAVFHRRRLGMAYEGYLLTEKVNDAVDLRGFLEEILKLPAAQCRRVLHLAIESLARLLREFHVRGLTHRDLKAANLLVKVEQALAMFSAGTAAPSYACDPAETPFCFIDLVGVACVQRVSRSQRVKNLARIHASFCDHPGISRTDKLRFLRTYLQLGFTGRHRWQRWWRAIAAATRAKIARNLRTGRLLT